MAEYQLIRDYDGVRRTADGAIIPNDPGNADWVVYTDWLAAGNVPDPAPPPSPAGAISQSASSLQIAQAKSLAAQGRTDEALAAVLDILEKQQ
jgi:hypothetical protein